MSTISIALIALAIGLWHDIKRFPATNKVVNALREDVASLKQDNEQLLKDVERLDTQLFELSNKIDRINDPEYYALLDAGDGWGMHELMKSRGEVE